MQSRLNANLPPHFHELEANEFQDFCCDLFAEEESVSSCDVYGTPGQSQRGIDLIAPRRDGDGNEVAQCKCHKELQVYLIEKASDDFLKHLEHWRERKVRRFVLIAACPLDRTEQQEAIQLQRARFEQHGIAYEAWSARTLRQKLAPYRAIAERYIAARDVVDNICGAHSGDTVQLPAGGAHLSRALDACGLQISYLSTELSREKSVRLEEARELLRRGQRMAAYDSLCAIRDDVSWSALEVPLRARVLRVLASCVADMDDGLERARDLANEAHALDPAANESLLRALLRYHESGPRTALEGLPLAHDVETFNYRVGLLLELGESDQALATLQSRSTSIAPNADTLRLQALALLTKGDIAGARSAIHQGLAEEPEWDGVRMVAAMIDYYSALSPAALPEMLSAVPAPVPWDYVKRDDASVGSLRTAERVFASLAATSERHPEQRRSFEIWELACLANDTGRQAEAADMCKALLLESPGDPYVLLWALARRYDFDRDSARSAIKQGIETPDAAAVMVGIQLSSGDADAALETLDRTKDLFVDAGVLERWLFYRTQALIVRSDLSAASEVADSAEDPNARRQLELLVLQARFDRNGEWQQLLTQLERALEETGESRFLYEACSLKAQLKDWAYIGDRAEQLVTAIGTPSAIHLAAGSLWNAGRAAACLDLLNGHMSLFPNGSLPRELRLLRVRCLQLVGQISTAAAEADAFVHEDPSTESLLSLIQSQFLSGDLKGIAVSARRVLDHDDVPAGELLRVARLLLSEDQDLAQRLWRRAMQSSALKEGEVVEAVNLAFGLGIEDEASPVLQRMRELAAQGSVLVKPVGLSELLSIMRSRADQVNAVGTAYRSGQLPVHLVSQLLNTPVVALVPGTGRRNQVNPDPRRQPPMLIRHGGRAPRKNEEAKRLHIDITGLMIAHDLDILGAVEQCFRPLRISSAAVPALLAQLDALMPSQPAHLSGQAHVLELVEAGRLELVEFSNAPDQMDPDLILRMGQWWVAVLTAARDDGSYLVDYLPLTTNDEHRMPVTLSESDSERVINCRTLVNALRRDGELSSRDHAKAITRLGTEGVEHPSKEVPERGATIALVGNTAGVLADSDLLNLVCSHFRTRVDPRYVEQIRGELAAAAASKSLREWLRPLVDRVQVGISAGAYEVLRLEDEVPEPDSPSDEPLRLEVQALRDLFAFEAAPGDVIWIDDRHLNSYSNLAGAAIVSVTDVLANLRARGAIDRDQYYGALLRLRSSNAHYIPLSAQEIRYHLEDAPIDNGRILETPALRTLRQHLATILLDSAALQRGEKPPEWSSPYGERDFVFQTLTAINRALASCFMSQGASDDPEARAEWILTSLYTGLFGAREVLGYESSIGFDDIARDIAIAMWSSLTIVAGDEEVTKRQRARYLRWIGERVLRGRLRVDPEVARAAAQALRSEALDKLDRHPELTPLGVGYRLGLQQVILEAPALIRKEFSRDSELFSRAGLVSTWAMEVGSITFPAADFIRAVAEALNGREAIVRASSPDADFRLAGASGEDIDRSAIPAVEIEEQEGSIRATVSEPRFRLLSHSLADRENVLRAHEDWFDCDAAQFETAITEIVSTPDPAQRIERLEIYRDSSAACYYSRIGETLRSSGRFAISDILPPRAFGLLNHFRLNVSEQVGCAHFADRLEAAGKTLLAEVDIEDAILRMACFPVRLPTAAFEAVGSLPPDDRLRLLATLEGHCWGPIPRLHLIALTASLAESCEQIQHILGRALDALFGADGEREFRVFHALLRRVHAEFADWPEANEWPTPERLALAWAHAVKLQTILRPDPRAADELAAWIESASFQIGGEPLSRRVDVWNDILHPRLLRREDILTSGLARMLQGCDRSIAESFGISARVRAVLVDRNSGSGLPSFSLLRDPCLATDCAGSIFGGDRGLALRTILEEDEAKVVSSQALHAIVQRCLEILEHDPVSQYAWTYMSAVVVGLPLYGDLREELGRVVHTLDLDALWLRDSFSGLVAIAFTAGQAAHLQDDALRSHAEQTLVIIASHLDGWKPEADKTEGVLLVEHHVASLIEAALHVTHYAGDPQTTSIKLSSLLINLADASRILQDALAKRARRLVWDLPMAQLHGLWRLELELRTGKSEGHRLAGS